MEPLVSVVIPVYKTEKYVVKSVNSILTQSYKNTEIIIVDDGSPDSCPKTVSYTHLFRTRSP